MTVKGLGREGDCKRVLGVRVTVKGFWERGWLLKGLGSEGDCKRVWGMRVTVKGLPERG